MKRRNIMIVLIVTLAVLIGSLTTTFAATGEVPAQKVDFPSSVTLNVGESKELAVTVTPGNSTYLTNIQWGCSSNGVVSYKSNGSGSYWGKASSETITGLSAGKAYLTTTVNVYDSNKKFIKKYTFNTNVTVTGTTSTTTIKDNNSSKNTSTSSTKTSSSTTSNSGTSQSSGTTKNSTTTTANTSDTQSTAPASVPMKSIRLGRTTLSVDEGKTAMLTVSFQPTNTTDNKSVTWTSSNTSIATVNSNGVITGKGDGTAVITAKCGKFSATCTAYVTGKDGYVTANIAYKDLNKFRTRKGVWQWNKNNKTKTYFNTKKSNTLKALKKDAALEKTARVRAKEAAQKFSHTRPNGKDCFTAFPKNIKYRGENLAAYVSEEDVIEVWMEDGMKYGKQGHRRNMLNKNFTAVGIAGYRKNGVTYWAMCLGKK